ncbi:MAG TPA: hypothetical protein VKU62_12830, partial [Thermoanaerobaculia bacterium]|nr:hypothetical protein [Thermoanaerobaculia bacterium]
MLTALLSTSVVAATRTWTGTTSANWSVATNWGGTAPVSGDDLVFPASGANQTTNDDLPAGTAFNSITFSGGTYVLNGNLIALGAGGITASGGTNQRINLPILLTASQSWNVTNGSTTLAAGGALNLAGAALTVSDISGGAIGFLGPVSGTGSITASEQTSLLFEALNTATAPITAHGGFVGFFDNTTYPGPITASGEPGAVVIAKGAIVGDVTVNGPLGTFVGGISATGPPNGTANTKNLTLRNLTVFEETIASATDFAQTSVTGTVNLTGSVIGIDSSTTLPAGTQFTIIQNDGTDPVVGTFAGSPQGGTVTSVLGSGIQNYTIDYHGGDGNDVVITAQAPVTTQTTTVLTNTPPSIGQPVTLTATVTPNTGTAIPTGTVTFFAIGGAFPGISSAVVLGTASLNGAGVATLTATL